MSDAAIGRIVPRYRNLEPKEAYIAEKSLDHRGVNLDPKSFLCLVAENCRPLLRWNTSFVDVHSGKGDAQPPIGCTMGTVSFQPYQVMDTVPMTA